MFEETFKLRGGGWGGGGGDTMKFFLALETKTCCKKFVLFFVSVSLPLTKHSFALATKTFSKNHVFHFYNKSFIKLDAYWLISMTLNVD